MTFSEKDLVDEIQKDFDTSELGKISFFQKLVQLGLIPFDISGSLGDQLYYFGYLGTGDMIGRYVQVPNVPILQLDSEEYDFSYSVGKVVGDFGGRLVVQLENVFFGWVDAAECSIPVNYHNLSDQLQ